LEHYQRPADLEFIYNGKSIVDDFGGKCPVKWALMVSKHLWSKDELQQHVLVPTNKSSRPPMSPTRVSLLKRALPVKFTACNDIQKFDKHWPAIVEQINNQGRNIGYQIRNLFKINQRAAEVATNNANRGDNEDDNGQ
jgi:hypothetical protein